MEATRDRRPGVTHVAGACPAPPAGPAPTPTFQWYALYTMSRAEFMIEAALRGYEIEPFCPSWFEVTEWSDRQKRVRRPLFPGYLFARCEAARFPDIVKIAGVIEILPSSLVPQPVDADEIDNLRRLIAAGRPMKVCSYLTGDAVVIDSGPLAGVKGVVKRTKNGTRVIVKIELLRRAVSVEVDAEDLVKEAA